MTLRCVLLRAIAALGVALAVALGGALVAAPLHAATPNSAAVPQPEGAEHAAHDLSREQAVAMVQTRYGARVVRTDFVDQDGRHLYVFRLLSAAGKVWIVRVDARTGSEVP
jgi:uncharacterized membrane protein YkoI